MTRRTRTKVIMTVVAAALLALFFVSQPRLLWHPYTGGSGCLEFKCGDDAYWFDAWCYPGGSVLVALRAPHVIRRPQLRENDQPGALTLNQA